MKRIMWIFALSFTVLSLGVPGPSTAQDFRYMTAEVLEQQLKAGTPLTVLDIQVEPEFARHHIKGAVPTYAYPVKTAEQKKKIDAVMPSLQSSSAPVVVVCPRGAGGARRTYRYLEEKGLATERLYILENGQAGWTFADLTEGK